MTHRALHVLFFIIGFGVGIAAPRWTAWSDIPKELRVSAIPDENPTELMRIYKPFADYLAKKLGIPVRYFNMVDYVATVEGLAAKKLDMV